MRMIWQLTTRGDPRARELADRHYNRQTVGATQFVPHGRCMVLYGESETGRALWVTSWPMAEYTQHRWAGAWTCSIFRNEGAGKATELIRNAVAVTRAFFGDPPDLGMITFVNPKMVRPFVTPKGREIFGQCFRQAGFVEDGETLERKYLALRLSPEKMPDPIAVWGHQAEMAFA